MKRYPFLRLWLATGLCLSGISALAQTDLPGVTVTAPAYSNQHGGYLISGDFKVDPRMPYVVYAAQALVKDDILSIEPIRLNDDEYLVLQECASADCSQASLVRVWNTLGATTHTHNSDNRIWIRHENKYFLWLKKLPEVPGGWVCTGCPSHFTLFEQFSPPLTLIPNGVLAQKFRVDLVDAEQAPPLKVLSQTHEGSTFVVTYESGSKVRIRRMHSVK